MEIVIVAKKKGIGDCGLENLLERLLLKYPTGESRRRRLSPEKHQSYDDHQAIVVGILSTAAVGVLQFSQKTVVPLHHPPPSQAHSSHQEKHIRRGIAAKRAATQRSAPTLPVRDSEERSYMEELKLQSEAVGQETQNPHTRERLHHVLLLPLFLLSQCITSSPLCTHNLFPSSGKRKEKAPGTTFPLTPKKKKKKKKLAATNNKSLFSVTEEEDATDESSGRALNPSRILSVILKNHL
jgi:hypothetical protein